MENTMNIASILPLSAQSCQSEMNIKITKSKLHLLVKWGPVPKHRIYNALRAFIHEIGYTKNALNCMDVMDSMNFLSTSHKSKAEKKMNGIRGTMCMHR